MSADRARVYLDWNATAPLRPEARAAMLHAMDVVGNPSSVHAEGRAARALLARARAQVADLIGCAAGDVVFTSGATEAAALALSGAGALTSEAEHPCVLAWADPVLAVDRNGRAAAACDAAPVARQVANGETGVIQPEGPVWFADAAQAAGRIPLRAEAECLALSAHKLGGPKGAGALVLRTCADVAPAIRGGGQERGRRAGTENLIGIAGFGAAAEAARRDLEAGVWDRVANLRNILENTLADAAPDLIIIGGKAPRLPNTSCFAVPGWKGETQVMQMDLAGFAVSAGAACSSGKVGPSRVLRAMGFDEITASSAIRVSLGPTTTEPEVLAFARTWIDHYNRRAGWAA